MVKPGAKPDLAARSDPPAAERFVHHHPDDHETEAIHHDDDIIDHDHDEPANEHSRLSAVEPACSATVTGPCWCSSAPGPVAHRP
jgi:hypothetical protein